MPKSKARDFFYLDDDGKMQDADLHLPIIASGDRRLGLREPALPLDEDMMAPIREKHRNAWLAKRKAKRDADNEEPQDQTPEIHF